MPRVLIVDDNEQNLYLLGAMLRGSGYEVVAAAEGAEALREARRAPVDLVISDILMPGMDGFSLCRAWEADDALRGIPFVFYTATYTDGRDRDFALSLGAAAFIVKPMEPAEFTAAIAAVLREAIGKRRAPGEGERPAEEVYLREYNAALVRKLEDKIVELKERNRELAVRDFAIASSISGIAFTDLRGRLTYANRTLAALTGRTEAELAGLPVRRLAAERRTFMAVARAVAGRGSWQGEVRVRRGGGETFTAQAAVHVVRDEAQAPVCVMVSCLDVTEQKAVEERLRRTQRLATLGSFAAGVAHDFNNILGATYCHLDLARLRLPAGSPAAEQIRGATESCDVARDLLKRLASFARGEAAPRRRIEVGECVERCARLCLAGAKARHELRVTGRPAIEGDETGIMELVSNLLVNAQQAMPEGGRILTTVAARVLAEGEVGQLPAGAYVEIGVADEGAGIPEEISAKVFAPFFTTKLEGSGLGLAICASIVRAHGGHIGLASKPGKGSRFTVLLPAAP